MVQKQFQVFLKNVENEFDEIWSQQPNDDHRRDGDWMVRRRFVRMTSRPSDISSRAMVLSKIMYVKAALYC